MPLTCCTPAHLPQLERTLAENESATAALTQWCAARHLADPPGIVAEPVAGDVAREPADARTLLAAGRHEPLGYRHVRLRCGGVTLSEAHNWFVPARLTPRMNATLAATPTPFGKVVAPLGFTRGRLASVRGRAEGCPQGTVLSHRAVLRRADGQPISLVVECYLASALR